MMIPMQNSKSESWHRPCCDGCCKARLYRRTRLSRCKRRIIARRSLTYNTRSWSSRMKSMSVSDTIGILCAYAASIICSAPSGLRFRQIMTGHILCDGSGNTRPVFPQRRIRRPPDTSMPTIRETTEKLTSPEQTTTSFYMRWSA